VSVGLSAAEPRAVLVVRNGGADPVRLEVSAVAWSQAADGQLETAPTDELVVFPPLVTVGPGEERNLRVASKARPGPAERTYRVFVQELPPPEKPGAHQIRVLSRLGIPVFLAPERTVSRAELAAEAGPPGQVRVTLKNPGTVHLSPATIRIAGLDARGMPVNVSAADAWYVLAGGERRLDVKLPADRCAEVRALDLQAAPEPLQAPVRTRLELPAGACAP
jgi:fimbrial chaperone protein